MQYFKRFWHFSKQVTKYQFYWQGCRYLELQTGETLAWQGSKRVIWTLFWSSSQILIKTSKRGLTLFLIVSHQGDFIVLYVWEIVVRKNLTNFEGCHFARFYILIWWSFPKIETKNFNSGPCFFKLVKLGTISPAAHFLNCVHIGRSQTISAIICGLSSGKCFVKLREVF